MDGLPAVGRRAVPPSQPLAYSVGALFTLAGTWAGWRYWRHDAVAIWITSVTALLVGFYLGGQIDWGIKAMAPLYERINNHIWQK